MLWRTILLVIASFVCSESFLTTGTLPTGCDGTTARLTATSASRTITSPGYPFNYPNSLNCRWEITAPAGNFISFTIRTLKSELKRDKLQICDDVPSVWGLIYCGIFSGSFRYKSLHTTGRIAQVEFKTDSSVTDDGFSLSYSSVSSIGHSACGYFPENHAALSTPTFIASPGYPNNYPSGLQCSWFITAPANKLIKFTFFDFQTERDRDTLTVRDGSSASGSMLGRFSGADAPGIFYTTQKTAYVTFSSNSYQQYKGFRFSAVYVDSVGCSGNLHRPATVVPGTLLSPGFPGNYPDSTSCGWNITAPEGRVVSFDFKMLATELNVDVITVYDGPSLSNPSLGVFSGNGSPNAFGTTGPQNSFSTTGPQALVIFQSNAATSSRGFQLTFKSETYRCGTRYLNAIPEPSTVTSPGYLRSYPRNVDCQWIITTSSAEIIIITPTFLGLSSGDYLEVFNGRNVNTKEKLGSFSFGSPPEALTTTGSHALLRFKTNGYTSGLEKGFNLTFHSVIYCGDPGTPDNGKRVGTNFTVGFSVSFYCDSMYKLSDDANVQRTCQRDGKWSGSQPECNRHTTLLALIVFVTLFGLVASVLTIYVICKRCNNDGSGVSQVSPVRPSQA